MESSGGDTYLPRTRHLPTYCTTTYLVHYYLNMSRKLQLVMSQLSSALSLEGLMTIATLLLSTGPHPCGILLYSGCCAQHRFLLSAKLIL